MKGHVGGGPGFLRLSGVGYSVKFRPFLYVSIYSTRIYCAGMAPENERFLIGLIPLGWRSDIKLESLILAQNERWRHA